MILIDVVDAERRKLVAALSPGTDPGPSRRPSETSSSQTAQPTQTSSSDLPDYETSQAELEKQKAIDVEKAAQRGQRRLRRFLVYFLVVYLVLSISVGVPLFVTLRKDAESDAIQENQEMWMKVGLPPPPPLPNGLPPDVLNLPVVYGSPIQCNDWTRVGESGSNGLYYTLQYTTPLNNSIYIRSNFSDVDADDDVTKSPITGSLRVGVVNDSSQTNATITVTMRTVGDENQSSVCLMGSNSTWGLAITVPGDATEDNYYFDINLELPRIQDGQPLCNLVTYLPSFNQTFDSLDSYMTLDSIDVEGSLGSIYFKSVHAKSILVKTTAASISGNFNATDSVTLETILQPISANVSLYNDGYASAPAQLSVETGNSNISLNVNLNGLSFPGGNCTPRYMAALNTFSGEIDANFYHDSNVDSSALFIRASNTLMPARVFVDRVFQGTYDVRTWLAEAIVERTTGLVDPTGAGRSRTFNDIYSTSSRAYGWVGWSERPDEAILLRDQGHIEVLSSLSPAILQLTGAPDISVLTSSDSSKAIDSRL